MNGQNTERTGKFNILTYKVGRDGRYTLFLYGMRFATVNNYEEARDEDLKLLEV
jgi:hypothetical protein